jgi:hypothetical protein
MIIENKNDNENIINSIDFLMNVVYIVNLHSKVMNKVQKTFKVQTFSYPLFQIYP